jgi:hypothetical protein
MTVDDLFGEGERSVEPVMSAWVYRRERRGMESRGVRLEDSQVKVIGRLVRSRASVETQHFCNARKQVGEVTTQPSGTNMRNQVDKGRQHT